MRELPLQHPGQPEYRSPTTFLWWMARGQWRSLAGGMIFGVIWMSAQAVMPALIGQAIDHGVSEGDRSQLWLWGLLMVLVGAVQAASGIIRHRFAVTNWLTAAYRTVQLVTRQSVRLGSGLKRRVSTGELVAIGTNDLSHLGNVMDVSARFTGAIVSFVLVAVILLQTSVMLGLVVLIGMPVLMLVISPILKPLQDRVLAMRELMGSLANTATDIVSGLRILRGVGGEQVFLRRYREKSQVTRQAGVRVARLQSSLDGLQVLLPGLFVAVVVWLGARSAVQGSITSGELVAFYGYAAFLVIPLRTATEFANKFIRARVSAQRVCHVLAVEPDFCDPETPLDPPAPDSPLTDERSGLVVRPGILTALVSAEPDESARVADRLGLQTATPDAGVRLGGVPLTQLRFADVRARIVVSDTDAALFSGPLGAQLAPHGGDVEQALYTASADDIMELLPDGLDSIVAERGRSFSGGQRQRLVLVRALMVDPEILILVEPTSAVDAHTEARIAARLPGHRAGRTTLVTTTSPLVLDRADEVVFLVGGAVAAIGTHHELLTTNPAYRAVVTREAADEMEVVR